MTTYKVQRTVDAAVIYTAEVEAESPERAVELASGEEEKYTWEEGDTVQYDARRFVALDKDGMDIEETARGDW